MIADSVEAASKSLKNPSEKDIYNLVDKIIKSKIDFGQLEDAAISFSELEKVRASVKKVLKSIYHIRVEYPEEKQQQDQKPVTPLDPANIQESIDKD
jgi:membrane-associated HD superfamily phosphohydrolase